MLMGPTRKRHYGFEPDVVGAGISMVAMEDKLKANIQRGRIDLPGPDDPVLHALVR
jgi:hypothetical protein